MGRVSDSIQLKLLGIGAMNSPRYRPAGLLLRFGRHKVMIDGGPGAEPRGKLSCWLVCDDRSELRRELRELARSHGADPAVVGYCAYGISIQPMPVTHTSHNTYGYLIEAERKTMVWAPEFFEFPNWASGADLMFAEAAAWDRPIRFAGSAGGHAPALEVARQAAGRGVARLIFAHIGRPTIRAMDAGKAPPFGEFGREGGVYRPINL